MCLFYIPFLTKTIINKVIIPETESRDIYENPIFERKVVPCLWMSHSINLIALSQF